MVKYPKLILSDQMKICNITKLCVSDIPRILAKGLTPSFSAFLAVISTSAAPPSFRVLALAAVTVPAPNQTILHNIYIKHTNTH